MDHLEDVWSAMPKDPLPQLNCLVCMLLTSFFFCKSWDKRNGRSLSLWNQKIEFCVLNGVSA